MSDRVTDRLRQAAGSGRATGGRAKNGSSAPDPEAWRRAVDAPGIRKAAEGRRARKREEEAGVNVGDLADGMADDLFGDGALEEADAAEAERTAAGEERTKTISRVAVIVMIVICAYVGVLIFGVFMTDYGYDASGKVAPVTLTAQDRREKAAFEVIEAQYENCRLLYQETLLLDYRVSQGVENVMVIAPEYEALLDEVTNLSVKVDALTVETQYAQIQSMLLTWIQDDIAVYLQNMAAGLSQNNEETLGNALVDAERVYNDFSIITQNIVAFGDTLNGVDLTEAKEWSPEGYVDGYINGGSR